LSGPLFMDVSYSDPSRLAELPRCVHFCFNDVKSEDSVMTTCVCREMENFVLVTFKAEVEFTACIGLLVRLQCDPWPEGPFDR